jgi:hypothetical protein
MSCFYCGKITKKGASYCNDACEINYTDLFNQESKPVFRTFQEAGKFYKRDFRTMKRFEGALFTIDKTLPSANTKWTVCVSCGEQSPKSKARRGYCVDCTAQGLGKKNQGLIISKRYKGPGNPNYIDGNSKSVEYQLNGTQKQFHLYSSTSQGNLTKLQSEWNLDKLDGTLYTAQAASSLIYSIGPV